MLVEKMAGASLLAGVADDFIREGSVAICTKKSAVTPNGKMCEMALSDCHSVLTGGVVAIFFSKSAL